MANQRFTEAVNWAQWKALGQALRICRMLSILKSFGPRCSRPPPSTAWAWGLGQFSWVWIPRSSSCQGPGLFSGGVFTRPRALNPLNFYAGEEYGRASTRGTYHISVQGLTRAGGLWVSLVCEQGDPPCPGPPASFHRANPAIKIIF